MTRFFLFGTLLDDVLRARVFGAQMTGVPAHLPDHAVERVDGGDWPILIERPGARAQGLMIETEARGADRAAYYEAAFGYSAEIVTVETDAGEVEALVYRAPDSLGSGEGWSLDDWQQTAGPMTRLAAIEAMAMHGEIDGAGLRRRMPTIRARAHSAVRAAAHAAPHDLRADIRRDDVAVLTHRQPYTDYFAVGETRLRHPMFGGGLSEPVKRAGFAMSDAVTVLPYDPVRDRVLFVEQFRFGPWLRGDPFPWTIEPIAGRIDPGETAETTARRETQEEAGIAVGALHEIGSYYASPGAVTEYVTSYVACVDLPDGTAGFGGLDAEHEDIRTHVVSRERAMDLMESGEVDTGPLMISLLWLDRNYRRLA